MDTSEITRNLADSALLERVRAGVEAAKNWPEPVFSAMAAWDFETAMTEYQEAREFAIAVHELALRAEKLDHEAREGLLAAVHPLPDQLKRARAFFSRLAPEFSRIRELEVYWKNNEFTRQRDKKFGVARIAIACFEKDVERIRAFVRQVNAESKFDEIVKKKKGGRPRKTPKPAEAATESTPETAPHAAPETTPTAAAAAAVEAAPSSPAEEPQWGRQETAEERAARERREADFKKFF
jgi:hypothetical protein